MISKAKVAIVSLQEPELWPDVPSFYVWQAFKGFWVPNGDYEGLQANVLPIDVSLGLADGMGREDAD